MDTHSNRRILIVDDQPEIHEDFLEMLRPYGATAQTDLLAPAFVAEEEADFLPDFELLHARSGEVAVAMVRSEREAGRPIAVAFVDVRMPPGIDGVETIRRIRKTDTELEIVIMTAYTDKPLSEIVRDMETLHKLLYIRKPFSREEIQQITLSLTAKWNVERSLAESRAQLLASHGRLEAVFDATGDAMVMYDVAGRAVFANQGFQALLDLDEDALRDLPPEGLERRCEERYREAAPSDGGFRANRGGILVEETSPGDDGGHRLFYRYAAPVLDDREEVIGSLVVYRDVSREVEAERMKAEVRRLRNELETSHAFGDMIGGSAGMREVYTLIRRATESDITVLIRGESGTGKELVARALHRNGPRGTGPFVAVNCAALPESLIESELFGHERGSFTGATQRRIGAFERAAGGTLLLDEIGAMRTDLQAKLLRVLQEREFSRIGGSDLISVDVRVIAATNRDLEDAIRNNAFREDLFYRLSAYPIAVPPLRDRREDIPLLANHFLAMCAVDTGKSVKSFSQAALGALLQYDWPGNVRELASVIERAFLLETGEALQVGSLPPEILPAPPIRDDRPAEPPAVLTLAQVERQAILRALETAANNVSEAARVLEINRATLYRKLKRYDLSPPKSAS